MTTANSRRSMIPPIRAWLASALIVIAVSLAAAGSAHAQSGGIDWSKPINLSNTPATSDHPAVLADPYGNVHVFWTEDMSDGSSGGGNEPGAPPNTIMYRRWDGTSWSEAMDVLAVPGDSLADYVAVTLDPAGRIHAVWTGLTNTYYSSAPALQAGNPHAWSQPVVIDTQNARSMREAYVAATPAGTVHIIYATRGSGTGVYYVEVDQAGKSSGVPKSISASMEWNEGGYANVRLVSDSSGRLHATWETFDSRGDSGQAVYYARSVDDGATWSAPVRFRSRETGDFSVNWIYVTPGAGSDLYAVYVGGGATQGRAYRVSRDGGDTWSEPATIVQELEGINGYVMPVVDGAGQVHMIADMRTRQDQTVGIYYARAAGNGFSPSVPIAVEDPYGPEAHYAAAAVRLGSEIHVAWEALDTREIWYLRGIVPGVTPARAMAAPSPAPQLASSARPTATRPATRSVATPVPAARPFPGSVAAESSESSSLGPVLIGIVPAVGLVLAAVLYGRARSRYPGKAR